MAGWKFQRGENALFEGTVLFASVAGGAVGTYDITGATLTVHIGSALGASMKTFSSTGSAVVITNATGGLYTVAFEPADTEGWSVGSYYYDVWLRTTAAKEYCLTLGTMTLLPVVGTI